MTVTLWLVVAIAIPTIISFAFGIVSFSGRKSFDNFVLGGRNISRNHYIATFTATNTALANILLLYSYWGFVYGIWAWLWGMIFWGVGFFVFARIAKWQRFIELTATNRPESGFNELMGVEYNSRLIATVCALISGIAFLLLLTLELNVGAKILSVLTPTPSGATPYIIALIIGSVLAMYVAYGGMNAVIRTDVVQLLFVVLGAVALPMLIIYLSPTTSIRALIISSAKSSPLFTLSWTYIPFVFGSLFSWGVWFLCTMDMWQRTIATTVERQVLGIKGILPSYVLLAIITSSGVLAGVYLKHHSTSPYPPKYPLVDFIHNAFVAVPDNSISLLLLAIVIAGFTAAMLSTVDTYLIIVSQCFVADFPCFWKDFPHRLIQKNPYDSELLRRKVQNFTAWIPFLAVALFYLLNKVATQDTFTLYMIAGSIPFAILPIVIGALTMSSLSRNSMARSAAIAAGTALVVSVAANLLLSRYALSSFDPRAFGMLYFIPFFTALIATLPFIGEIWNWMQKLFSR